jgi:methyl-accepting chemotaxis protein
VDALYIGLLQIRRGEKDLGLRRDPEYRQRVLDLLDAFAERLAVSQLAPAVNERLQAELALYREAFVAYAEQVLSGADIQGGKGPFRQAAHRIEDILVAHRVPDMESRILQLRRREKDYLLRLDPRYVEMALKEWEGIRGSVRASAIAEAEKGQLLGLLDDYRRDFLALVEQNRLIDRLKQEMKQAAAEVLTLADATEAEANRATEEATARINQEAERNAAVMVWVVLLALVLGVLFAVLITRRITRPLLEMAGFLDRLAFEAPVGRIPAPPDSRDEVVAMAESVNRMADHKTSMIAWWKSSLEEMEAERDRWVARSRAAEGSADADASEAAAVQTWNAAAGERARLLRSSHEEMQTEARCIERAARQLGPGGQEIYTAAREILSRLDIILRKH